jgi:RNA polymerase sigma-70 factor (ECF subfamily)
LAWQTAVLPEPEREPASDDQGSGGEGIFSPGAGGSPPRSADSAGLHGSSNSSSSSPRSEPCPPPDGLWSQTSDEALVEAICRGQAAALEELWRRYGALLASQAQRVLQSAADADDAVAEVFEEVWARPATYHVERARPVAWLLTLVRRRSIDRLRVRKRHRRIEVWLAAERPRLPDADGAGQDGELHRAELRDLLARAMHRLPEKQRLTVWLAYYRGCSHREIARETCCPVGTVKTRLESALRKMREGLSPGGRRGCAEKFSDFC